MKAAIYNNYGGPQVLKLTDIKKPVPGPGEVLVKVACSSVTAGAIIARRGSHPDFPFFTPLIRLMFGLSKPKNPVTGYEFSGTIESLGSGTDGYAIGDRVFGTTTGLKQGSYAEYVCVPTSWKQGVMAKLPKSLTFEEGAGLPVGAMTAKYLLDRTSLSKDSRVMIYGASGSVGTFMVQYAKSKGARVTAVCSSRNHEILRSLGADELLDYAAEAFKSHTGKYDVIADAVGKMSKADKKRLKKDQGTLTSISSPTKETDELLKAMTDLAAKGEVKVYIDEIYDLDNIVAAHAYAEKGHKRGNLIIRHP